MIFCLLLLATCGARAADSPKTYTYKAVEGCEIKADVYRPADTKVCPVVIWMHGGSLISGGRENPTEVNRYLAAGIAVVSIDYRLAPETKLPEILLDLRDAYLWVRQKGPELFQIDPDRVALVGHSAGGYLALAGGYTLQPRPKAVVSFYGYGAVDGAWCNGPHPPDPGDEPVSRQAFDAAVSPRPISFSPPDSPSRSLVKRYIKEQRQWTKAVTGFDPALNPGAFDAFCPVRNVTPQYPPTMLLHGDKDPGVPYEESVAMEKELKSKGVDVQLIIIKGGLHSFERKNLNEAQRTALYKRVLAFLNAHLGNTRAEP